MNANASSWLMHTIVLPALIAFDIDHAADLTRQIKGVESVDTSNLQIGAN